MSSQRKTSDAPRFPHVEDPRATLAIETALATGRALLVRGEPGIGKSQLAQNAARKDGWDFRWMTVDNRSEPQDVGYTVDLIARLGRAQLLGAQRAPLTTPPKAKKSSRSKEPMPAPDPRDLAPELDLENFLTPGPLWYAFAWKSAIEQSGRAAAYCTVRGPRGESNSNDGDANKRVCVLIDEIDKADPSFPNGLLEHLGERSFDVPGFGRVQWDSKSGQPAPLVVITTNEERVLPDAFLRRCVVLHLMAPDLAISRGLEVKESMESWLLARGRAHFPSQLAPKVLDKAVAMLIEQRRDLLVQDAFRPGLAEFLDLLRAVSELPRKEQLPRLDLVSEFFWNKQSLQS